MNTDTAFLCKLESRQFTFYIDNKSMVHTPFVVDSANKGFSVLPFTDIKLHAANDLVRK